MQEAIFFKNKKIGEIDYEKKCYISPRTELHIFRKFGNGFGASVNLLQYLQSKKIEFFFVLFHGEGWRKMYYCMVYDFYEYGEIWNDKGDIQRVLPLKYWTEVVPS